MVMSALRSYPLQSSAVLRLNAEKDLINVEPWYQRRGDVWTREKKQLLIDSILNEFDIPKLYFHDLSKVNPEPDDSQYDYAIIDGRQRLETIWEFMDDRFPLDSEFRYLADESVQAGDLTYSDLASKYPKLKIRFDSFTLPIICIETDDIDLIEDMFSRLNEAVPLSSAEKRNAIGGEMAEAIRDVAEHGFFTECVRFGNKRYQYREVAARLLFIEYCLKNKERLIDTKKPYLDAMVRDLKNSEVEADELRILCNTTLDVLKDIFAPKDDLLRSQSVIPVIYLLAREANNAGKVEVIDRGGLVRFFRSVADNRRTAEMDIAKANFELLEFDRMSQQGTNDAASIRERVRILAARFGVDLQLK